MLLSRIFSLSLVPVIAAAGCAHQGMERAGDAMLRVERATQGLSDGVVAFKDATKQDCIARELATEAERAACVDKAVKALEITRVGVSAVAAALTTFWEAYAILEARQNAGERLSQADVLALAQHGARVAAAYERLVREVQEVRR